MYINTLNIHFNRVRKINKMCVNSMKLLQIAASFNYRSLMTSLSTISSNIDVEEMLY